MLNQIPPLSGLIIFVYQNPNIMPDMQNNNMAGQLMAKLKEIKDNL